jgi:hypothetical protein
VFQVQTLAGIEVSSGPGCFKVERGLRFKSFVTLVFPDMPVASGYIDWHKTATCKLEKN